MLRRASLLVVLPFAAITGCSGDDDLVTPEDTGADSTTVDVAPDTFAPDTAIDTTDETRLPDSTIAETADATMTPETDAVDDVSDAMDADAPPPEPEIWVVRVGEDTKDVDSSATKVEIERIRLVDKVKVGTISFPVSSTTDGGDGSTFTLTGDDIEAEGSLTRSVDGKFVTLVGYLAPVGYGSVKSSATPPIPRVIARIDALATVDMTTTTTSLSTKAIHTSLTVDGSSYWIADHAEIRMIAHGSSSPASAPIVVSDAGVTSGARALAGWPGQLFGSDPGVFEITPPTRVALSAMTPFPDYNGIVVSPTSGTPADAFYACDLSGNIDHWTRSGTIWTKAGSFSIPSPDGASTVGCTQLTAALIAGKKTIVATTYELAPRLVEVVDDGTLSPPVIVLATSTERRPYRGVAFAPNP